MCNKYNGWTNYETWNVSMWLDNEEGSYSYIQDTARDVIRRETSKEDAVYSLQSTIKDYVEENNPLSKDTSMYSDMLQAAIDSANFYEIAEGIIDELWEEEEDEDLETEEE